MERSDEARREDSLYDRIGSLERRNKHLEAVIEHQKETIRNQGNANEEKHNILCGIKEEIDEYFLKG